MRRLQCAEKGRVGAPDGVNNTVGTLSYCTASHPTIRLFSWQNQLQETQHKREVEPADSLATDDLTTMVEEAEYNQHVEEVKKSGHKPLPRAKDKDR